MISLELLAPAKDFSTGQAALLHGADAVYIGAPKYGARSAVGNTIEDIEKLTAFAHQFRSKVYITLNTLLFDNECPEAEKMLWECYEAGADAFIIQDLAFLEMNLPPVAIHASTQMHNFHAERIAFLKNVGFQRAILARELSITEIENIHNKVPDIELEAFIHGALCSSLSGQCYLSHFLTGRSGNRGVCAQPCRSFYTLKNASGKTLVKHSGLLSTKDFSADRFLEQMVHFGIRSFKIEGRLKDISYVKNVTAFYHRRLNEIIAKDPQTYTRSSQGEVFIDFTPDPSLSFNRGFTSFYLSGKNDYSGGFHAKSIGEYIGTVQQSIGTDLVLHTFKPLHNGDGLCFLDNHIVEGFFVNSVQNNRITINKPLFLKKGTRIFRNKNVAFEKQLAQSNTTRKIRVSALLKEEPKGFSLQFQDEEGNRGVAFLETPKEPAKNTDRFEENLFRILGKSGDTVFTMQKLDIEISKPYFLPVSEWNSLRRHALADLKKNRSETYVREVVHRNVNDIPYPKKRLDYHYNITNHKAAQFYQRHGVISFDWGYEIEDDPQKQNKKELMTSRNCIRFQLGKCPTHQSFDADYQEPLFLEDNQHRYRLTFDCSHCMMSVSEDR